MSKRAWLVGLAMVAVVTGCRGERERAAVPSGRGPAGATDATASAGAPPRTTGPSPYAATFAVLPAAIASVTPLPLDWPRQQLVESPDPVLQAACWDRLAATVDGYYGVEVRDAPQQTVFHAHLVHGRIGLDALRACRVPASRRKESKHPRVLVASDSGFFPVVFVDLGHDWLLMLDGELAPVLAAAEALATAAPVTDHHLADVVGATAAPGWYALAVDPTGGPLGVPALGIRAEFTPWSGTDPPTDPVTVAVVFASADAAQRALAAATAPDRPLDAPWLSDAVAQAGSAGDLRVEGATVVYRGPVPAALFGLQWHVRP